MASCDSTASLEALRKGDGANLTVTVITGELCQLMWHRASALIAIFEVDPGAMDD